MFVEPRFAGTVGRFGGMSDNGVGLEYRDLVFEVDPTRAFQGRQHGAAVAAQKQMTAGSGNTIRGSLSCTDPAAEGDFHARVEGPEHFVTRVRLASVRGDLDLETDARWLAASCGSAGAAAKPAR